MSETTTTTFHPRVRHSLSYYSNVLEYLVLGLSTKLSDKGIAELLNANRCPAPSGRPWTVTAVSSALFKLRNFRTHPNRLHHALMELIYEGFLKPSEVGILFEPRPKVVM